MIVGILFTGFLAVACWPAYRDLWKRRDDVRQALKGGNDD